MIDSSGTTSAGGRLRLSVESSHSVTTSTRASSHQSRNPAMLSAPAWWPSLVPCPRALAQRRLPSSMTPTWRGSDSRCRRRLSRRSYAAYRRSDNATVTPSQARRTDVRAPHHATPVPGGGWGRMPAMSPPSDDRSADSFYSLDDSGPGSSTVTSSRHTAGPWSPDAQHGGPPMALMAREAGRLAGEDRVVSRVTCDLL